MSESKSDGHLDMDVSLDGEEEMLFEATGTSEDNEFDMAVGAIEEILMDEEFVSVQSEFCERHCAIFTEDEENKLEYMPIFEQYTALIGAPVTLPAVSDPPPDLTFTESTLQRMLTDRLSGFNMRKFEEDIVARKDEVSGDVFDLLLSIGDFTEFKELMLSNKRAMASSGGAAAGGMLELHGHSVA